MLKSWCDLWQRLGLHGDAVPVGEALLQAWSEPQRAYHTVEHLRECLALFQRYREFAWHADEVEVALWFHDAVYEPKAHDNERRSADWAVEVLRAGGADAGVIARVEALIMVTAHAAAPSGSDQCLLVDIDLAILGADAARYDRFDRAVRAEYRHVPLWAFVIGRRRILLGFLERPQLYSVPALRDVFEENALRNLRRSLSWTRVWLFARA